MQRRAKSGLNLGSRKAIAGISDLMECCRLLRFLIRVDFWLKEGLDGGYLRCHRWESKGLRQMRRLRKTTNQIVQLCNDGGIQFACQMFRLLTSRPNVEGIIFISQHQT